MILGASLRFSLPWNTGGQSDSARNPKVTRRWRCWVTALHPYMQIKCREETPKSRAEGSSRDWDLGDVWSTKEHSVCVHDRKHT